VGQTDSNDGDVSGNHGLNNAWVVKLDGNGNIQWQKCIGGSGNDTAYGIQVISANIFVLAGYTASSDGDFPVNQGEDDSFIIGLEF
jgi:hypothetical protein